MITPKDKLVLVTSGEYEEYNHYLGRVLTSFNLDDVYREYIKVHPNEAKKYHFDDDNFAEYLVGQGYIEKIEYSELSLGRYGCYYDGNGMCLSEG